MYSVSANGSSASSPRKTVADSTHIFKCDEPSERPEEKQRALEARLKKDFLLRQQLSSALRKQNRLRTGKTDLLFGTAISAKSSLQDAACVMAAHNLTHLLVLDGNKGSREEIVGMIGMEQMRNALGEGRDCRKTTVAVVMNGSPPLVQLNQQSPQLLLKTMLNSGCHTIPLLDGDEIIGVESLDDLLLEKVSIPTEMLIADVLNAADRVPTIVSGEPKMPVISLCQALNAEDSMCALILDKMQMVGTCSIQNLILRVIAVGGDCSRTTTIRVMTPAPRTISPETPLLEALQCMRENGGHVVVEQDNRIVAVLDAPQIAHQLLEYNDKLINAMGNEGEALQDEGSFAGLDYWKPPSLPAIDSSNTEDDLSQAGFDLPNYNDGDEPDVNTAERVLKESFKHNQVLIIAEEKVKMIQSNDTRLAEPVIEEVVFTKPQLSTKPKEAVKSKALIAPVNKSKKTVRAFSNYFLNSWWLYVFFGGCTSVVAAVVFLVRRGFFGHGVVYSVYRECADRSAKLFASTRPLKKVNF